MVKLIKIGDKMIQVKKFYAEWCGPCKMLTPIMEQVQGKFSDVSFESINIDSQFEVAQKYYVRSVPTVIIEKDGKEVQRFAGLQSEMAYSNAINELKS
jgi:thioredoxin 1